MRNLINITLLGGGVAAMIFGKPFAAMTCLALYWMCDAYHECARADRAEAALSRIEATLTDCGEAVSA